MDIIDQIIRARKEKGISQQQLADMTGIFQPVIARVESKKSRPTIDFIYKLLDALDLQLSLEDSFYCPKEIENKIKGPDRKRCSFGRSGSRTYSFDKKYILKISNNLKEIRNEKEKTDWFYSHSLSEKVVKYVEENGIGYLLRAYVNGHTLIEKRYLDNPSRLISILKEVITTLRNLDNEDCPFKSEESEGNDFVHGDLCLPNIVVDDNDKLVGFIDVSSAGKGDKEYDYSWLVWSFEYNLKSKDYTEQLLKELNISIDSRRYVSYVLPAIINKK